MAITTVDGDTGSEIGGFGPGTDDRYVFDGLNIEAGQEILVSDTSGDNTIQLTNGLEIASSSVTSGAVQLTLNNGAVITVLDADTFTFQTGGNGTNGTGGTEESYEDFATNVLGVTVPAEGDAPVAGDPVTIDDGGTVGGPGQTFELTTGADITGALEGSAGTTDTSGDDTFTGAVGTFNSTDVLIGGDGTDTLTADVDGSGAVTAGTVAGIETITLNNTAFDSTGPYNLDGIADGEVTINNTAITGATTATANNTGNIDLIAGTNVDTLTVLQKEDATTNVDAGSANAVNFGVVAAGADQAVNLTVNNDVALDINAGDVTDLTITSTVASEVTYDDNSTNGVETITADANTTLVGANDITDFDGDTITGAAGVVGAAAAGPTDLSDVDAPITLTAGAAANVTIADDATVTTEDGGNALTLTADDDEDNAIVTEQTANLSLDVANVAGVTLASDGNGDTITTANITANEDQTSLTLTNAVDDTTFNIDGSGDVTLDLTSAVGTGSVVDATGLTGVLTATADAEVLDITGGAGNDVITAVTNAEFDLDGGAGSNTLVSVANMTEGTFENFALLQFATGHAFTASQLNGLTIVAEGVGGASVDIGNADIDTATIDLSGITFADVTDGVDMSNATEDTSVITTGSALTITGSNGADILLGLAGDDVIDGGAGDDVITGAGGDDVMTGGAGSDSFNIAFGGEGEDTITDFTVADDIIDFDGTSDVANVTNDGAFDNTTLVGNGDTTADALDADHGFMVVDNGDANTNDAGGLTAADIATYLADIDGNGDNVAYENAGGDSVLYMAVSDGTDTVVFQADASGNADAVIDAGEITIIGTLTGIGDAGTLTAANLADFA